VKFSNIGYAVVIAATAVALTVGAAEAKGKKAKKPAAPAMAAATCWVPDSPTKYCAVKGGMKFTYANSCVAKAEGAKIISNKACPAPKAAKAGGKKKAKAAPKKK
jgi:hypothetical protein